MITNDWLYIPGLSFISLLNSDTYNVDLPALIQELNKQDESQQKLIESQQQQINELKQSMEKLVAK